ncbi:MAG: hypothetical protein KFF50_01085, partial [Desulfatitalea sp.]|nr:hypothetical protein [Desulfatitalea sp.]
EELLERAAAVGGDFEDGGIPIAGHEKPSLGRNGPLIPCPCNKKRIEFKFNLLNALALEPKFLCIFLTR